MKQRQAKAFKASKTVKIFDKKAQFYILTAAILLTMAFTIIALSSKTNTFKKKDNSFEELHENYIREVSEVVNNVIYEKNQNSLEKINANKINLFTKEFLNYAHTKQPTFSLTYMFSYYDDVSIVNYLDEDMMISIDGTNYSLSYGDIVDVSSSNSYSIYAFDNKYDFENEQDISFHALFKSTQGKEVRIFAYE